MYRNIDKGRRDVNAKDNKGRTPLYYATGGPREHALIEAGASKN